MAYKERFEEEVAAGILEFLGQNWEEVHVALVGSSDDLSTVASQVVLGGTVLGPTPDETELVIALRPDEVSAVASYLSSVDGAEVRRLMDLHSGEIEQVFTKLDDWEGMLTFLIRTLGDLRVFYVSAAKAGDAVFKIVYG
jgi:predicted trehalose synthase